MEAKLSKLNQSVEKTMKLVEILSSSHTPMKLQDISSAAGIPNSTALRMLNTLLTLGYVNQDEDTLRYSLSLKFAYIGECATRQVNISRTAHPDLIRLARMTGECVCFAVEQNSEVVYLDVITEQANNILTVTQRIGKRAPLYCTGIGKLILTNYSQDALMNYMNNTNLIRYTEKTIVTLVELQAELAKINHLGYAVDDEECDLGARCLAAPIRNYTGHVVAGISVTAPALRLTPERIKSLAPTVLDAAFSISKALGYQG